MSDVALGIYGLAIGTFGLVREYLRDRLPIHSVGRDPIWRKRRILASIGMLVIGIIFLIASRF